jgi:integrase
MLKKLFRKDGPVFDTANFRREWIKACVKLGLGKKAGEEWHQYEGLIPHDFRRSAARNLIRAGVDQSIAMRITGHRTVAVFRRYSIFSTEQTDEVMAKVSKNATKTQIVIGGSRNNP